MSFISTQAILSSLPEEYKNRFTKVKRITGSAHKFIFSCHDEKLKKQVILKTCSGPTKDAINNELELSNMLKDHPNISDCLVNILESKYVYLVDEEVHLLIVVMDEYQYGDLRKWLRTYYSNKPVPHLLIYKIFHMLYEALNVIHSYIIDENNNRIMHRDIKLENIFVEEFDEEKQYIHIRLGDFGDGVLNNGTHESSFRGTPTYLAPEVANERKWSPKSDIWSAGVVILKLITKDFDHDSKHLYENPKEKLKELIPQEYRVFVKLLEKMLRTKRENRYILYDDDFSELYRAGYVKEEFMSPSKELELYLFYLGEEKKYELALDVLKNYENYNNLSLYGKSRFHHLKGYFLFFFGERGNEEEYIRALEIYPYSATSYNNLGIIERDKGDFNKSIEYYKKALAINENHFSALKNIGMQYVKNNKKEEGRKFLERALELDEDDFELMFNISKYCDLPLESKFELCKRGLELGDADCAGLGLAICLHNHSNSVVTFEKANYFYENAFRLDESIPTLKEIRESKEWKELEQKSKGKEPEQSNKNYFSNIMSTFVGLFGLRSDLPNEQHTKNISSTKNWCEKYQH